MRKTVTFAVALLVLSVMLTGCPRIEEKPKVAPPEVEAPPAVAPPVEPTAEISEDITGVGTLEEELETSDLDTIEEDLADIEELFG